jgi:hypothetical protein
MMSRGSCRDPLHVEKDTTALIALPVSSGMVLRGPREDLSLCSRNLPDCAMVEGGASPG